MSINLKTSAIFLMSITIIALSISTCSLSNRLDNTKKQLEQLQSIIENKSHEVQKYQNMCKLMQENERIKSESVASFVKYSNRAKVEHVERIKTIEKSRDSCDWLDMPVPDSIRMLFNTSGGNRIHSDYTTSRADETL